MLPCDIWPELPDTSNGVSNWLIHTLGEKALCQYIPHFRLLPATCIENLTLKIYDRIQKHKTIGGWLVDQNAS